MNARCTPKQILNAHPSDQCPQIGRDLRPASQVSRFPAPITAKTSTMPAHERLGPDDRHGLEDRWKPTIQLNEEQAIAVRELDPTAYLPLKHGHETLFLLRACDLRRGASGAPRDRSLQCRLSWRPALALRARSRLSQQLRRLCAPGGRAHETAVCRRTRRGDSDLLLHAGNAAEQPAVRCRLDLASRAGTTSFPAVILELLYRRHLDLPRSAHHVELSERPTKPSSCAFRHRHDRSTIPSRHRQGQAC